MNKTWTLIRDQDPPAGAQRWRHQAYTARYGGSEVDARRSPPEEATDLFALFALFLKWVGEYTEANRARGFACDLLRFLN